MLNTTVVAQMNVCVYMLLLLLPLMLYGAIGGVCMHNNNGNDDGDDDYDDITNGVNTISRAFCQFSIRLTSIWDAWCVLCVLRLEIFFSL